MRYPKKAKAAVSLLLAPLLALSSLFSALPAAAQPEVIERVETAVRAPASAELAPITLAPALTAIPAASIEGLTAATLASPAAAQIALQARSASASASTSQAAPQTVFGRLTEAVKAGFALPSQISALYEGRPAFARGVLTLPQSAPVLRDGVHLDAKPQPTDVGAVRTKRFHLSRDALPDGSRPVELDADPNDPASVEKALRDLVDSDPKKYGASSADMAKVHVKLVRGSKDQNQADTYYAIFRQWKKGVDRDGKPYYLAVDGGNLAFVIKVFADGKPVVMATEGRLFPDISADIMTPAFDDDELQKLAENRLHTPTKSSTTAKAKRQLAKIWAAAKRAVGASKETKPELLTRQITNVEGAWRAVNVYQASDLKGRPVIVGVDVKTGDSFAWSAQELIRGQALGRGNTLTKDGTDHGPVDAMPLPYANILDKNGAVAATADENGRFSMPDASGPVQLTVKLGGKYAQVTDESAKASLPEATATASNGPQTTRIVVNADGGDAAKLADVNGYVYYSRQVAWLQGPGGIDDARVLTPLGGGVRTNKKDMPGNAYFSPSDDSLNLEAEATVRMRDEDGKIQTVHLEGTDKASIVYHESTHRAVQILSQIELTAEQKADKAYRFVARLIEPIMDGGVNEAIADTVSMFMRGNPIIGDGYRIDAPEGEPNFIRTGENDTKFDPKNPDPHAQGEAFMGFTWTIRQALIEALGEAAGAAYAALMVVPTTLYSQPQDVPAAMLHVLLGSMTKDGKLPHENLIRKPAADHGVEIPQVPSAPRPSA